MKATEILNVLKTIKSEEYVSFTLVDEKDRVYCNGETGNIMDFYSFGEIYGVYSDLVDWGQVDSRKNSDEEILTAIEKVLSYDKNAKVVNRKEAVNFDKTYMY